MAPIRQYRGDSSDGESASGSESSDSGQSDNFASAPEETAASPGRTYKDSDSEGQPSSKSASNSPASHKSDSPEQSQPSHSRSQSREKSQSPAHGRSRSSSYEKSPSPKSNISKQSSPKSNYSHSPASSVRSHSHKGSVRSQKSPSPTNSHVSRSRASSNSPRSSKGSGSPRSRSRSRSGSSNHSDRSNRSNRSNISNRSNASNRSNKSNRSNASNRSNVSNRSNGSNRSDGSNRSNRSNTSNRSNRTNKSNVSNRSNRSPNRYDSAKSGGSNSPASQNSRSPSPVVNGVKPQSNDADSDEEVGQRRRARSLSDDSHASNKEDNEGTNDEEEVENKKSKPTRRLDSGSSSSGDEKSKDPATAEALFGDADDITSEEDVRSKKSEGSDIEEVDETVERKSDDEEERKSEGEKEKEEEKEEAIPETRIDVEIPRIVCDIGRDLHFVKLPNFLSVDTRPFSADTYEDEIDEEETLDEEGRARLKLKVENTIRWRDAFDKDGNPTKESNARMVRWSDGSMSLHLGSEIFDVYKQPLQGDHNHLFIRQGTGLQGQAVFRTKLTFRPHSTESFTHRKMTLSLADRSQKSTGIKVLSQVGHDPDQYRGEMIKKEEERLRATLRRENKAKRTRERGAGRPLNTSYLEPDREDGSDDEGAISLNAIKNKYQAKNDRKQNIYSSDDEDSDLEARRPRRSEKMRALQESDDEGGDDGRSGRISVGSDES